LIAPILTIVHLLAGDTKLIMDTLLLMMRLGQRGIDSHQYFDLYRPERDAIEALMTGQRADRPSKHSSIR
jgi:hypothetical protein